MSKISRFCTLFPESKRIQSAPCEYFVAIVRLCKQAVVFMKKLFRSQLSSSIFKPFESEFGIFQRDLDFWQALSEKRFPWPQTKHSIVRQQKCPDFEHLQKNSQRLQHETLKRSERGREKRQSCYFSTLALFTIMKMPGSRHANKVMPVEYDMTRDTNNENKTTSPMHCGVLVY